MRMEAAIGLGIESRDVIFFEDGSRARKVAPATVDEGKPFIEPLVDPVVAPAPLLAVTNVPHHCRVQRLRPRRILEPSPRQLHHPIHKSLFDYLGAIWIALGRNRS